MIARQDIERLLKKSAGERPILSIFLDMSVNAENKRTHRLFLNKKRSRLEEEADGRAELDDVAEAFERVDEWLDEAYDEANQGAALYTELGGDWFEAYQFPVPTSNRMERSDLPVVGPLVELLESYHHHGVALVDRENLRLLSLYQDRTIFETQVEGEYKGEPHDVHRGLYSHRDYHDRREKEETKHWFKEFAGEVADFVARFRPDDLILLGTEENVQRFREFLPERVRGMVTHTARAPVDASRSEVLDRLRDVFRAQAKRREEELVALLQDRLAGSHYAVGGFHDTLVELQEGKVDSLLLGRNVERSGARCTSCGFYLDRDRDACPYCGGAVRQGVDLVEAMVRIAEDKGVDVTFVSADALRDQQGIGALLRY